MDSQTGWERARGFRSLDLNCYDLLVLADVEEVARAIAEGAIVWDRDVLGRSIVVQAESLFVFRLKGHDWSVVVERHTARSGFGRDGINAEKSLSRRLGTSLIVFATSDVCVTIGYTLIEDGEEVEDFSGVDDGESGADLETSRFFSARREVELARVGNLYDFVEGVLRERGAFHPGIEFDYFLDHEPVESGDRRTVENPGFAIKYPWGLVRDTPEIERVDHLVLKPKPERG